MSRLPRRTQFVCQHLENISREALEKHQAIVRKYVRRRQGVYALYRRGKPYYVGLAGNLRSRLTMHLKDRHHESWDRFSVYLTIGDSHLRELEALILRIVRPAGNKQIGKFPHSEDLRRKFTQDIRQYQRRELQAIIGTKSKPKSKAKTQVTPKGRQPVLAAYFRGPLDLRAQYKGKLLRARVRRDGRIRFGGKLYGFSYKPAFDQFNASLFRRPKGVTGVWSLRHQAALD